MSSIRSSELWLALAARKHYVAAVFIFSLALNLLALTPLFYMMNVYDKAVASGSYTTLVALAAIALFVLHYGGIRLGAPLYSKKSQLRLTETSARAFIRFVLSVSRVVLMRSVLVLSPLLTFKRSGNL